MLDFYFEGEHLSFWFALHFFKLHYNSESTSRVFADQSAYSMQNVHVNSSSV